MGHEEAKVHALTHTHTRAHTHTGSKAAGMHEAGEATRRASAVCARPLHEPAGPLSIPGLHLPMGSLESGPREEEGLRLEPGCASLCPGKLRLSSEGLCTFMQRRCRPGTKSFATGAHQHKGKGGTGRAGDQTRAAEGAWGRCVVSQRTPGLRRQLAAPGPAW